ncbi:hypothetical protein [Neobacillus terrae]|uniref:hypothetical protein n=1 Tax=Neobacillus terrae TaxID=3034837 RepID=UPI001409814B|nr:hypothetical protein [Neobacillus terrae]NHM32931.1 hypothetical protein [Neobacillus terrae]
MERAIIYGTFQFVGFHLCTALLAKGWEVTGISFPENEIESYADEKRLEIGRNANFTEAGLEAAAGETSNHEKKAVIVSLFDLFMEFKDDSITEQDNLKSFIKSLESNDNGKNLFVFLLPVQMLSDSFQADILFTLRAFLSELPIPEQRCQHIYLPSLYGPWQPATFYVQQAILGDMGNKAEIKSDREWTADLIFITDAVAKLTETIESERSGRYLLESSIENYWENCILQLKSINKPVPEHRPLNTFNENHLLGLRIKKITSFVEGYAMQQKHNERLRDSEIWK